ncbi:heparin lyase I family protein [Pontibacter sp. 13R65]|uniref:heparin lyase I family protein n=1 Tax=Pontibacter sp. 13R65 TaxID=3127458 RepID=UPI00301D940C
MKLKLSGIFAPILIGALAISCEPKELEEIAPANTLSLENTKFATSANLLIEETFETSSLFSGIRQQFGTSHAFSVSSTTVYNGSKAGRFELRDSDPLVSNGTRSEVLFPAQNSMDRWYAFSLYLPSEHWQSDSKQEIITQWHQGPTNPPMSLRIINDRMFLDVRRFAGSSIKLPVEGWNPLPKDQWVSIVFHIVFDHHAGVTDMWVNGEKKLAYRGGNCFAEKDLARGTTEIIPRWKLGIYKSDWNGTKTTDTKKRVLYFDEIRMGNERATLADMTPRKGTTSPPPAVSGSMLTNVGGTQLIDSQSRTWSADGGFTGGVVAEKSISVSGTSDANLYRSYRYASSGRTFGYSVPVKSSGLYTVKLHFVEPYFKASNARVFDVSVQGKRVLSSYDIHREAGFGRAVVKTFTGVSVTNGTLNIDFASLKNNAIVSAIEVVEQ